MNFAKFLRTPFLIEHLQWLLLYDTRETYLIKVLIKLLSKNAEENLNTANITRFGFFMDINRTSNL